MTECFFFSSLFLLLLSLLLFSSLCNFSPCGFFIFLASEHLLMHPSVHTYATSPLLLSSFPFPEFFPIQPSVQLSLAPPAQQLGHRQPEPCARMNHCQPHVPLGKRCNWYPYPAEFGGHPIILGASQQPPSPSPSQTMDPLTILHAMSPSCRLSIFLPNQIICKIINVSCAAVIYR